MFSRSEQEIFLLDKIKELETKLTLNDEIKLHEVERKFILGKFEKKQNATEWLAKFEAECSRHKVSQDSKIIEVLRISYPPPCDLLQGMATKRDKGVSALTPAAFGRLVRGCNPGADRGGAPRSPPGG